MTAPYCVKATVANETLLKEDQSSVILEGFYVRQDKFDNLEGKGLLLVCLEHTHWYAPLTLVEKVQVISCNVCPVRCKGN